MKKVMNRRFLRAAALIALLLGTAACKKEVDMPMQSVKLSTHSILSPSFATKYTFEVMGNCDWTVELRGDGAAQWATLSNDGAIGTATVAISAARNESPQSRSLKVRVVSGDRTSFDELTFVQAPATAEGYISIADIRALAADGEYTVTEPMKLRGFVVSNVQEGNYYDKCLALQGENIPDSGIALRTDEKLYVATGDELEIELMNAVLGIGAETGVLELKAENDDRIVRTDTSRIVPEAVGIGYADLVSGKYESMFVSLGVQAINDDLDKVLGDGITMQTADGDLFPLLVQSASTFVKHTVPSGSGTVSGIVCRSNNTTALAPRTSSDIVLTGTRFNGGIKLPYIISLMTTGTTNGAVKYSNYNGDNGTGHADDVSLTTKDGSGATITAKLCSSGSNLGFRHWHENSGHHNCPMKSWTTGDENYVLITLPLNENLSGALRLTFGLGSTNGGPANWKMLYSADNSTWHTPAPTDAPHFVIPTGKPVGSGKNFFYYTIDFTPEVALEKGGTLYIRLTPYDTTSVNGGTVGNGGEIRLHSCVVLERVPSFSTAKPADALYFEPFDGLTEGLDYRYGNKLCAMLNYCGSDISSWSDDIRNGLTGTNVRQRPSYAQIGFVETQTIAQNAYTNNAGALTTPAFGATGTLNVTFDAMAYKNASVFSLSNPNNNAKDIAGDITTVTVEVIGGGTIDGATKTTIGGLSYTEFKTFAFTIDDATESTALKFTSDPADGQFSRWFIDNICITK
ncbi:MAG: BACON domain-containing protein [Alistipes sp.]|nr:BACON domain-containing protein [Alistipes sp.]